MGHKNSHKNRHIGEILVIVLLVNVRVPIKRLTDIRGLP